MCYLSLPMGIETIFLYCEIRKASRAVFLFCAQITTAGKMPPSICVWLVVYMPALPTGPNQGTNGLQSAAASITALPHWVCCSENTCTQKHTRINQHQYKTDHKHLFLANWLQNIDAYAGSGAARTPGKVSAPPNIPLQRLGAVRAHSVRCRSAFRFGSRFAPHGQSNFSYYSPVHMVHGITWHAEATTKFAYWETNWL